MKHYRLNQIAMAVLGALLLIFGTRTLVNIAFEEHEPEKPGYEVAGTKSEHKAEEKPAEEAAAGAELASLLAAADPARGETTAAICKACHTFDPGAPSPIGPNLHGVVGRKIASVEGFNYSPALKAKSDETWTYAHLDAFIHKPSGFAPGTLMAFPGLPDAKQRADVIAFLRAKTDNPPPLPEPMAAKEAPGGEATKPAEAAGKPVGEAGPGAEILPALAKADPKKGEADAALCKVCHSLEKGAPSPIGPNLYGVVGRKIASVEGFNYSPALKSKSSEGDWTFEHLDLWLKSPQAFAAGTTMAFPGLPDLKTRADVIDFLRTKADNPVPLPEAAPAAPAAEEKPAEAPTAPAAVEKPAEAPAAPAAEEKPAEAPAAPTVEEKPAEAPAAPAAEEKPAEETPAAPAPEETPAEETPAAPAAEEKPAEETPAAPAAGETPAEETPAAPAAEEKPAEKPAEETPAAPATEEKPEETPAAPAAEETPAEETPPAPAAEEKSEEEAPAETPEASEATSTDAYDPSQPKTVYPSGSAEASPAYPAESLETAPAAEAMPAEAPTSTTKMESIEAYDPSQPKTVYPSGSPEN